jgi:glycosyltransferase involved in cell wall biosynthesis/peptidoglycan/xylan/chitin deacetylase (PgdA/CDA1 family)
MDGMQHFSSQIGGSSQRSSSQSSVSSDADAFSQVLAAGEPETRPHVLFLIDHLMALGGGETNLLKVVRLMPPELVRCSIATFRISPEIRKSISVPVHVFPWKRVYHLDALQAAGALRKLIRDENVDIVQTYFETSNLWGGLVAKLSGALLLSSRRDMGILRQAKHELAYRLVNRLSDRVLAVSEEVKRFCIDTDRIAPEKISVVYNGVDLSHIPAEEAQDNPFANAEWAGASHIVTCLANIRRIKGIDVLIRTAQRVCHELPNAMFVIAGTAYEGDYSQEIREMIRAYGLEKNVKLLGFVGDPVPLLKMSNAFCMLSHSEGFSNALLEAMSCGAPSVVTRVGGNPEAIHDGENGFLVPVGDDATAAERLLFLLKNPERAIEIGKAGRTSVQTHFSAETMINKLIGLYRDLLEERDSKRNLKKDYKVMPFARPALRAQGKTLWAGLLRASGLLYVARKWVQRNGAIVLTFHRVLADSEVQQTASLPGMIVRSTTFSGFLKYASEACEFIDATHGPQSGPSAKLKLAVTFDDGWSDNATAAYPLARQFKAPIVIFIVADKMGTELPFWPERTAAALDRELSTYDPERPPNYIEQAIEQLKELPASEREHRINQMTSAYNALHTSAVDRTMTWAQIAELHAGGVRFGSHTSTHEILTTIPLAQAEQEITSSRACIELKLNAPCSLFSYPNGDCSDPVRRLVASTGYDFAFLNQEPGVWTRDCDPFLIPRVNVCEYHLVDSKGNFSPLIFDYAVVWSAAKGLLARMLATKQQKLRSRWQAWLAKPGEPAEQEQL